MTTVGYTDPTTGETNYYSAEQGVPGEYAARGASTVTAYQTMAASDLSDKQIAANQRIADQQADLNQKQYDKLQEQYEKQQKQTSDQAARQSTYDSGRADLLAQGTRDVTNAFAGFTDDYFKQYAKDYLGKATDQIDYQKDLATKDLGYALARQGLGSSQAGVNQTGLIQETAGRKTAEETDAAQAAEASLRSSTSAAKNDLLNQVAAAESIVSPVAGSTIEYVNSAFQTNKSAITEITSSAGDVAAPLKAVPTVDSLGTIFSGVLGSAGSTLGGLEAGSARGAFARGFSGTNPSGTSSTTNRKI